MRARLMEATVECLVEHGYAGTTLARVAERAQVSRGGQVHHFPSKEQLVIAAVRHLNELRGAETMALLESLEGRRDLVDRLLDALWESHRGAVFAATAEMWIAGRTDPRLAEHLGEVEDTVTANITTGGRTDAAFRDALFTSMDAMRGLVMSSWHLPDKVVAARWRRLKRHLVSLFPA